MVPYMENMEPFRIWLYIGYIRHHGHDRLYYIAYRVHGVKLENDFTKLIVTIELLKMASAKNDNKVVFKKTS